MIIEDIIDSGKTIGLVYEFLKKLNPKHIRLCSLIMSGKNRKTNNNNFTFSIDRLLTLNNDSWIVGFGIDFQEKFRNLTDIYSIQWSKSKELIKIK